MGSHKYLVTVESKQSFRATWKLLDRLLGCYYGRDCLPFDAVEVVNAKQEDTAEDRQTLPTTQVKTPAAVFNITDKDLIQACADVDMTSPTAVTALERMEKFLGKTYRPVTNQAKTPAAPAQEEICSMGSECFEPDNSLMCFKSSKCKW